MTLADPSPAPLLPAVPTQFAASPRDPAALAILAQSALREFSLLNIPPPAWVPDGPGAALDALVVGGGMCGQTVAFALWREGLRRVRVIDARKRGDEGPWGTFARMTTLRSPKHLTGPDLGVPSLTFRSWYEAQHGAGGAGRHAGAPGWAGLHKVGRLDWRDYLLWVRDVVASAGGPVVENSVQLEKVEAAAGHLRATVMTPDGQQTIPARKLVLALGREGSGAPRWPDFPGLRGLSAARFEPGQQRAYVFHTADAIDFVFFRGRHVAVLGAGASAFDNAACALEAGAQVSLFARRPHLPQVNKSKWTSFPGFLRGYVGASDAQRWRYYTYILDEQVPPPWETVRRCDQHAAFAVRLGTPWCDVRPRADGRVDVQMTGGTETFDAVIFGTGFDVDLLDRPELAGWHTDIDTWADHVTPAQAATHPECARFPYLGDGFELQPRAGVAPDQAAHLGRMHLFNWGSTLSQGALAGDIPGLAIGAQRLAQAIVRDLFVADTDTHWQHLQAHEDAEMLPTRWYVPPGERGASPA